MAKRKKPRTPPPRRPIRAELSQPLVYPNDRVGDVVDVEPLFMAVRTGLLDDYLEQLATVVNKRFEVIEEQREVAAARHLCAGARVRIGHNLRPLYLHGRPATVVEKDGEKWIVRLDEPVGRFTNADLRLYARQLEPW
jgi:hypothetical protein